MKTFKWVLTLRCRCGSWFKSTTEDYDGVEACRDAEDFRRRHMEWCDQIPYPMELEEVEVDEEE